MLKKVAEGANRDQRKLMRKYEKMKKKIDLTTWHEEGRKLSNNYCEVCGHYFSPNMLTGHHVFSQKAYPQWRLNPKNRLIVCQECHNKIHNGQIKIDREKYRPTD